MRIEQIHRVCQALGLRPSARPSGQWLPVPCPLAAWRHTGGPNSDNAKGTKASGGFLISPVGHTKYMCRVCQHTPINLGELSSLLHHLMRAAPQPRPINFQALQYLVTQEQAQQVDELTFMAQMMQGAFTGDEDYAAEVHTREWPEDYLLSMVKVQESEEAMRYCLCRGIHPAVLEYLAVRWDSRRRRIAFPIRDENWALVGLHGRLIDDYKPLRPEWADWPDPNELLDAGVDCCVHYPEEKIPLRYYAYACDIGGEAVRNSHIWCNQHLVDMNKPVIVTEGNFDYCAIMSAGFWNVLGSRSTGIHSAMLKYLERADTIITYYDYGTGGDTARERITKYFHGRGHTIRHIIPDPIWDDAGATPSCIIQQNLRRFIL